MGSVIKINEIQGMILPFRERQNYSLYTVTEARGLFKCLGGAKSYHILTQ
jgi:hypothetical protein